MQPLQLTDISTKVIVNYELTTDFILDTFSVCRTLPNNYIDITLTVRDLNDAMFGATYYLEFFGFPSKYSGYYVCSKVEEYTPGKSNAVMMCIIPLIQEGK